MICFIRNLTWLLLPSLAVWHGNNSLHKQSGMVMIHFISSLAWWWFASLAVWHGYDGLHLQSETVMTGPGSAAGNVSGYRYVSKIQRSWVWSRPGPILSWRLIMKSFLRHSPSFRWIIQEGLLSVTSKSMCTKYWLTASCSSLPRKKVWLDELTIPPWP